MSNMLGFSRAVIAVLVVLCCSNAFAANCGSTWITSVADADTLRQNCRVVTGHVGIGPFSGNDTVHINLDGVEVIEGTLGEYPYTQRDYLTQPSYTLSSSSLKKADAVEFGNYDTHIVNLTLSSLTSVNNYVNIGIYAYNLVYLDLTSLHSADSITLGSPNLHTLHHTELRNVTTLAIGPMEINSLDSLSDNELNLDELYISGPFPNVSNIAIGFTSVNYIQISGNSPITLGGSSTKEMSIKQLNLESITDLKRSAKLKTLEVDSMKLSGPIHITHLEIPFDNLRQLQVLQRENNPLKSITLPPKAVNWTGGFGLVITGGPDLNLTSMYGADDQGKRIQTWYWPKNVSLIDISGATVGNTFFDPFVNQQMGLNKDFPPSVLSYFRINPSANSTTFNCTTFRELEGMGRLPSDGYKFACYNSYLVSGAIRVHVPITLSLFGAVLGIYIWMI
ncbi:hypothetical protein N7517_009009 [Penicillium concentricum]|uniref:Uncharacterized protein n=1 Tax=Penicillium concentricum TaxID=293559 RepID=A0A9W9RLL8_9EURO|nr:uncharacterized protein N7517_009009 [Penicillium concentricum]KAJ5359818.1 hypothetical protein N7517_009009 [Penicillium concentricum]